MAEPLTILFYNDFWPCRPASVPDCPWPCRLLFEPAALPEADVVVFHIPTLRGTVDVEERPGQLWVGWSMESDVNYPASSSPAFLSQLDLTMTYRRDSDIWVPYLGPEMLEAMRSPPATKTALAPAVYFASNARDRSGRGQYVAELMQHLQVDSYGRCLCNQTLPDDAGRTTKLETIARYRFTLAFENSITSDYVTEKFFDPLLVGSVPVYLGAPNVADFSPGDRAYIDARSFRGPAELAEYLRFLAAHPESYLEYLAWKSAPLRAGFIQMVEAISVHPICRLAGLAHQRLAGRLRADKAPARSLSSGSTRQAAPIQQESAVWLPAKPAADTADEPIDVVYCWVDSADPAWRRSYDEHRLQSPAGLSGQLRPHLYRDNEELRFSLRSLTQFAPWVRQVYLVTNGQVPSWLDRSRPGLRVIPHETIFPDHRHLPTFNSHAIELHLHRIPGLSRHFIYFNDDVFLGQPIERRDFLDPDGTQRIGLEDWCLPTNPYGGPIHDRAYAYTQYRLDAKSARRFWRRAIAHTPQLYDRELVSEVQERWAAEVAETSAHRFRSSRDIAFRVLYYHYALESDRHRLRHRAMPSHNESSDYYFVRLRAPSSEVSPVLDRLLLTRPRLFCINDELDDSSEADGIRERLRQTLSAYFPLPSPFEQARTGDTPTLG